MKHTILWQYNDIVVSKNNTVSVNKCTVTTIHDSRTYPNSWQTELPQ